MSFLDVSGRIHFFNCWIWPSSEDALWAELDQLTQTFLARWEAIRVGAPLPEPADRPSLLELCRELAYRMLAHCNFCPWDCRGAPASSSEPASSPPAHG